MARSPLPASENLHIISPAISSCKYRRGTLPVQISIAELAARPAERTSRDFVPWRFSDAGLRSAWSDRRCRRPKTCTFRRLLACDEKGVTFKWKDYRLEGRERYKLMTLPIHEFIRRFLLHVLPAGFHRIRYYGLLASGKRAENIARARELLAPPVIALDTIKAASSNAEEAQMPEHRCPCCGGRMIIIERFQPGSTPHHHPSPPAPVLRIDTS